MKKINEGIFSNKNKINEDLIMYSKLGNLKNVIKCLNNDADIHYKNDLAFRWAVHKNHYTVVKVLIKRGADIESSDNDAIRYASYLGYLDIVKLLIQNGVNIFVGNYEVFRFALKQGQFEVLNYLINYVKNNYPKEYPRVKKYNGLVKEEVNY